MKTVADILRIKGPEVAQIDEGASVLDAAVAMNERHIGALVVVSEGRVVGIFTERDVLNRVVAQQLDPAQTIVRDVMTAPVACCTPQTTRAECRAAMKQRRVRHLPVMDDDRLVGIVSIGDVLQDETHEQEETIHYLYEYVHGEVR